MPDFLIICSFSEDTVLGASSPRPFLTAARQNAKSASIVVMPSAASTIRFRISIDSVILHSLSTFLSVFSSSFLSGSGVDKTVMYFSSSKGSVYTADNIMTWVLVNLPLLEICLR